MKPCPICPINEILRNEPEWGQMPHLNQKRTKHVRFGKCEAFTNTIKNKQVVGNCVAVKTGVYITETIPYSALTR